MKLVSNNDVVQQRADCRGCTRRNSVLCASLQEQDSEQSRQSIDLCSLLPGALLYRAGDQGRRFFTIRSGLLKLVQYLPDGTQRIVRLLGANDVAGLEALLGQPYHHDAVVVRATEACSLPVALVKAMSQTNAEALPRTPHPLAEGSAGRGCLAHRVLHRLRPETDRTPTAAPDGG